MAEQLADAALSEDGEALTRGLVFGAADAVGVVPVHERVVEADLEAELAAGVYILLHEVQSRIQGVMGGKAAGILLSARFHRSMAT